MAALREGVDDYLAKPFERPEELDARILKAGLDPVRFREDMHDILEAAAAEARQLAQLTVRRA